jgi:hypothetical protein
MNPQLIRKYLDILNEQSQPPSQEFINQLDTAYRTGEGPGAEVMSGLGRDQQEMMLRNQGAWVNRDSEVQKGMNPNAPVYNPNQQDIDSREAGLQAMLDRQTDPEKKAQLLKGIQSREINKPYFTTTQPTATDPKGKSQPTPEKPAPVKAEPVAAAAKVEPYASPVDFNKRAGVMPVADTGLGKLSGGVSLGGSTTDYMNPSMRAELANQSGGKFVADVGQNTQQLGYQQKFGNDTTGQLAINRNAQGGMSAGFGGETKLDNNWSLTGGVSTPVYGQGDTQVNVGLKRNL